MADDVRINITFFHIWAEANTEILGKISFCIQLF